MPINLMGMFFFIGSEIALFGSFFLAYFFLRVAELADYSSWAQQIGDILPMGVVAANSIVLFSSSVTIHYAEIALKRGARGWQAIWVALTLLLGVMFLSVQIAEYGHLVKEELLGPSTSAYSSVFFSLTGLHGSHVLVGAVLLAIMLVRTLRGHYGPAHDQHIGFRTMSIYWHFVDVVWIFVFGLIYVPGNWSSWDGATMELPLVGSLGIPAQTGFFIGLAAVIVLMFLPNLIGKGAPKHGHS